MKRKKIIKLLLSSSLAFCLILAVSSCQENQTNNGGGNSDRNGVRIGISSENLIFQEEIESLTKQATGKPAQIIAKGSVSLTKLACSGSLDAIAIADEMWPNIQCPEANWIDTSGSLYRTRIQFALPQKTAMKLGWDKKVVPRKEVLESLKSGKLQLATTIPTHSNSGYNTLLWLTKETITPNLTPQQITPIALKPLQSIYKNLAKSSESTAYLAETLAQDWPKDTIAALYRFLYAADGTALYHKGGILPLKEPVTLIEVTPAITVTPSWFVSTEDETLKKQLIEGVFNQLETKNPQKFQQIKKLNPPLPPTVSIESTPIAEIHRNLLDNFHPSIRQKRWIVGIIDASGSMSGQGYNQLLAAFSELLDPEKAKNNFLYSPDDRFSIIIYQKNTAYQIPRKSSSELEFSRERLLESLKKEVKPSGGTPVDKGLIVGLETASMVSSDYKIEIFLFTDGRFSNPVNSKLLQLHQKLSEKGAELTVVGTGKINERQLEILSEQLDARPIISQDSAQTLEELLKAFREAQI